MEKEEKSKGQDDLGNGKCEDQEFLQEELACETVNEEQRRKESVSTESEKELQVNRNHKDGLFRMLMSRKRSKLI